MRDREKNFMHEVVIDTNILISAMLKKGPARTIVNKWLTQEFHLNISPHLLNELVFVLQKPKLSKWLSTFDSGLLVSAIKARARLVKPSHKINICRDSKDNIVLECAVEAKADVIVTGDRDLIVLSPFNGIKIISPRMFLNRLESRRI